MANSAGKHRLDLGKQLPVLSSHLLLKILLERRDTVAGDEAVEGVGVRKRQRARMCVHVCGRACMRACVRACMRGERRQRSATSTG